MPNSDHFQEFKPLLLPGNDFIKIQEICKENIFGKWNAKRKKRKQTRKEESQTTKKIGKQHVKMKANPKHSCGRPVNKKLDLTFEKALYWKHHNL